MRSTCFDVIPGQFLLFRRNARRRRGGHGSGGLAGGGALAQKVGAGGANRRHAQKHHIRHAGNDAEQGQYAAGDPQRSGLTQHLRHDLLAHVVRTRNARNQNGDGDRQQQRRNLRDQPVADGQQRIGAAGIGERHAVLRRADDGAAEQIDEHDQDAGDGVAAHELAGAVHRAVEVGLLAHFLPADDGISLRDDAGVQIGVDRHLPAGHRVQGEARTDFRDASRHPW